MKKFLRKHLDNSLMMSCLVFSLIFNVMFNTSVFLHNFDFSFSGFFFSSFEVVRDFVFLMFAMFAVFLGLSIHRHVFNIVSFILFASSAAASYSLFMYEAAPTYALIGDLWGLNFEQLKSAITLRFILWEVFTIAIWVYSLRQYRIETSRAFIVKILSAVCLFLFAINIVSPYFEFLHYYFPFQFLHHTYEYFFW